MGLMKIEMVGGSSKRDCGSWRVALTEVGAGWPDGKRSLVFIPVPSQPKTPFVMEEPGVKP
jgi:hypothetical protein